jgi:uncharacterized protein
LLGNIKENNLADMAFSTQQKQFGFAKPDTLPQYCQDCEFLFACHGECPKNRILHTPDGEPGLNYLCRGLKKYFKHIKSRVENMTHQIQAQKNNVERKIGHGV